MSSSIWSIDTISTFEIELHYSFLASRLDDIRLGALRQASQTCPVDALGTVGRIGITNY
jgi:hypothetical protein